MGTRGMARPVVVAAALALLAMTMFGGFRTATVGAQATPVASPSIGECQPLSGTATAAGSPVAGDELFLGTPVSDQIAEEVSAAAANFVACWNAGNIDALVSVTTSHFLELQFGTSDADELSAMLGGGLPPITVETLDTVQQYDDGRVSVDVRYQLGDYQVIGARHFFIEDDGEFLVDEEALIGTQVDTDSVIISFLADAETPVLFDSRSEIASLPAIILFGTNDTSEAMTFTAVKLPATMDGTPSAETGVPADAEFVGQLRLQPGAQDEMVLLGLEPGMYALTTADGGFATLTITEPTA